jgi:hypothetical protein
MISSKGSYIEGSNSGNASEGEFLVDRIKGNRVRRSRQPEESSSEDEEYKPEASKDEEYIPEADEVKMEGDEGEFASETQAAEAEAAEDDNGVWIEVVVFENGIGTKKNIKVNEKHRE